MPQMQLPVFPAGLTSIDRNIGFQCESGKLVYFHGRLPVFEHDADDVRSFRLYTSQLIERGTVRQGEIAQSFGVPSITVKRAFPDSRLRRCWPTSPGTAGSRRKNFACWRPSGRLTCRISIGASEACWRPRRASSAGFPARLWGLFLQSGKPVQPDLEALAKYQRRAGAPGGVWPPSPEISQRHVGPLRPAAKRGRAVSIASKMGPFAARSPARQRRFFSMRREAQPKVFRVSPVSPLPYFRGFRLSLRYWCLLNGPGPASVAIPIDFRAAGGFRGKDRQVFGSLSKRVQSRLKRGQIHGAASLGVLGQRFEGMLDHLFGRAKPAGRELILENPLALRIELNVHFIGACFMRSF